MAGVVLAVAGVAHGAVARDAALHTSLRAVLDQAYGGFAIETIESAAVREPARLRGRLTEDASDRDDFISLRVNAEALLVGGSWRPVAGGVTLTVSGASGRERVREWRAGRVIEAPVTFRRPARYLDDGVPDFERDAALDGLSLLGSVKSGLLVDVVRRGALLNEAAAAGRTVVRRAIARWVAPHGDVSAAIVTAVLIGDRTGLPEEVRTRLQAAGTYHVIAISGGNIAILAVLTVVTLELLALPRRVVALVAIVVLIAYAALVTAGPSVWRATLMAVLYCGARVLDHRTPPWHAMALAAAAIAIVRPLDVRDVGFLLTFGATAGLLGAAGLVSVWTPRNRVIAWVVASMIASLAAELVVLPVSASVFSRVTAAGLVLNLIAIPAMATAQVAGMLVVAFDHVEAVASAAGWVAASGAWLLVESARLVDVVPSLVSRTPPPAAWIVATYYVTLLIAWRRGTSRVRHVSQVLLVVAGLCIATGTDPGRSVRHPAGLRLTMVDVGQGEAMLLEAGGASLLIDAGGSPFGGGADIGGRVLAPALWARDVRRLGMIAVTHGDPDHIGGAAGILTDFRPRALWWGIPVPPHQPSRDLFAAAGSHDVHVEFLRAGRTISLGAARLRVLNPPEPDWERQRVRNDDSVVIEVTYGDVALLLTGDISEDVERAIAPQLTPARIRVLKVAHHGSRTSSSRELLESWRPQIALISCGRGNTFGHPAPDVVSRLESIGARIYRTDRDGEITVSTDGKAIQIQTFTGTHR